MTSTSPVCQIARTLDVVGEKWSLLIVREALKGKTRFSEFRDGLAAPSDILTNRLAKLVAADVLEKRSYREAGERERSSYHLTPRGEALRVVIAAMVQWGDEFNPAPQGAASRVVDSRDDSALRLAYVREDGVEVATDFAAIAPGPAASSGWDY